MATSKLPSDPFWDARASTTPNGALANVRPFTPEEFQDTFAPTSIDALDDHIDWEWFDHARHDH